MSLCADTLSDLFNPAMPAGMTAAQKRKIAREKQFPPRVLEFDKEIITEFHHFADKGHLEELKNFISIHGNKIINAQNERGDTALIAAAKSRKNEIINYLLEQGANPNICSDDGWSPLIWVTRDNNTDAMRLLLDEGADPNLAADDGWTPLIWAARSGNLHHVEMLLEKKADPNMVTDLEDGEWSPLIWAARDEKYAIAEKLIAHGAKVDHYTKDDAYTGITPVYWAAQNADTDMLELLIKNNADVNHACIHGYTPMMRAILNSDSKDRKTLEKTLGLLLEGGADTRIKDLQGKNIYDKLKKSPLLKIIEQFDMNMLSNGINRPLKVFKKPITFKK